jgi:DNA-directed RNA polymerase specialized sigma24 family protein
MRGDLPFDLPFDVPIEDEEQEDDPGPLVRPFAVTRGRAGRDQHKLDILTMVAATRSEADVAGLDREYREILRLCQHETMSIAEIAAHLDLLLAAVKVLVSDLIDSGLLIHHPPLPAAGVRDIKLLQAVLDGVRKL